MGTATERPTQPIAHIANLSLRYRKALALDDISLDLPASRMVGLIGPDGVGKSSLLSLLAGARRVQRGGLEVLGGGRGKGFQSPVVPVGKPLVIAVGQQVPGGNEVGLITRLQRPRAAETF